VSEPILCDRCEAEVATQGDVCDDCWQEYYATDLDDGVSEEPGT
jgi:hypothetical protein